MTKRMFAMLLALAMVLSCLSGCQTGAPAETTQSTTQAPTTEATAEPTAEPTTVPTEPEETGFVLEYLMTEEDLTKCDEMIANCETLSYDVNATRETVEAAWEELDDFLDYISTQVSIAQVIYYKNMDDETLSQTYLDAYDDFLALADKANLLQKKMYDDSPVKDWFFEDWSERDILYLQNYKSEVIELQARLNQLEVDFQALDSTQIYEGFVPLYIEYVDVANQIARLNGYDNYYDYSSELTYGRDYDKEELEAFQTYVKQYVAPKLDAYMNPYESAMARLNSEELNTVVYFLERDFDSIPNGKNYLKLYIDSFQGSTHDGFQHLFDNGYYIMTDAAESYAGAFCTDFGYYDISYCFFGPGYQGTSTVVHEMGHYYASYYENDDAAFDLLETHSQANEALLTAFTKKHMTTAEYNFIKAYFRINNVMTILIATMVDDFEQRIYSLDSLEGFTAADIDAIIDDVCDKYFGDKGGSEYVCSSMTDIYNYIRQVTINSPCYYISYATSLVTTMNFFSLAQRDADGAREIYRKLVEEAWENTESYLGALEYAGAASPFDESSFKGAF